MECKNLIVITGTSCQGKTYITWKLRGRYGIHSIHTDMIYTPDDGRPPSTAKMGELDKVKEDYLKAQIPLMTETTILEGSHAGNQAELDLIKEVLGFNGKAYQFRVESPNYEKQFNDKYKYASEKKKKMIKNWCKSLYNLQGVTMIVSGEEEIVKFLEDEENVYLSR